MGVDRMVCMGQLALTGSTRCTKYSAISNLTMPWNLTR